MVLDSNVNRPHPRGVSRRRFVATAAGSAGLLAIGGISSAQDDGGEFPDARLVSTRDFDAEIIHTLYTYRKRRALEVLLSDPEVHAVAEDMRSSYEAYDPYTNSLDAVSVQGSPDVEIEGGLDEGVVDVTAVDRRIAYGLVDRRTDSLAALTITDPQDVSWRAWEADDAGLEEARLRRILEDARVQEYADGNDWFPSLPVAESITATGEIERGGVIPIVLFVDEGEAITAVVVDLDVRNDDVGDVSDVTRVERFVEVPPHELAATIVPADDTVLGTVPSVPLERRPWYTAVDGGHRIEDPPEPFDRDGWRIGWDDSGAHGVEIAAEFRERPVFASLESPVTFSGYGLPERDGENTLEWFFPDGESAFSGDVLVWDVHSVGVGGPGLLGTVTYPGGADRPAGFRFRAHYQTGARGAEGRDHRSGYRFGQSSHELATEFWEDGTVVPIWRRQGPGFGTEYAATIADGVSADAETDVEADPGAVVDGDASENGVPHHSIATVAMDVTPGTTDGVAIERSDGAEWTTPETEFYLVGEPGTAVRFSNPEGPETIGVPLEDGMEVVVVRRSAGEIPGAQRLENREIETAFVHPAQYIGDEPIQGERVVAWLLLEAATARLPHPTGTTSFETQATMRLSGY
ncbi:hypothetical protein HTZ84_17065 [Haloterrigena sp. SYSU A558-1]|uniref:Secreted protein n=1 Tax=Haloterrigena gelatinilytica TaxID=2741724 RepID=A0ABX2LCJ8_9EURY|nr:hypothetical protein [Haloterrigena gelatinilytica]